MKTQVLTADAADRVCRRNVAIAPLVTLGFGVVAMESFSAVTIRHLTTFFVYSSTMYFLSSASNTVFTAGKGTSFDGQHGKFFPSFHATANSPSAGALVTFLYVQKNKE